MPCCWRHPEITFRCFEKLLIFAIFLLIFGNVLIINQDNILDLDECSQGKECKQKPMCGEGFFLSDDGKHCLDVGPNRTCVIPNNSAFPNCEQKARWMLKFWKSHPCFKRFGVDGSTCSVLIFLSEVVKECPVVKERIKLGHESMQRMTEAETERYKNDILLTQILHNSRDTGWIKNRISLQWNEWVSAFGALKTKQNLGKRRKKNILVFIGILAEKSWNWADNAKKGGPLGELLQWADLIAAIYLLGHNVYVATSTKEIRTSSQRSLSPCGDQLVGIAQNDLIYTDMHGLLSLKHAGFNMTELRCKFRILDTFGTEPKFNYGGEATQDSQVDASGRFKKKEKKNAYFGWQFNLKQYMTLFPHTPDNSFLGFAVTQKTNEDVTTKKKHWALVYGKQNYMWKGCTPFLSVLRKYVHVQATVGADWATSGQNDNRSGLFNVPGFVSNHGLLSWKDYQQLLRSTKIFVGLGFPFEGPAPLEAVARGAVFLNPKWDPPVSRVNDVKFNKKWFFKDKPTSRKLMSQHPYMEIFIGRPHVYTVDIKDEHAVKRIVKEILNNFKQNKIKAYVPYQFTHEGMLQRLNAYIEKQNFCSNEASWPERKALRVIVSSIDESCKDSCWRNGLVCENTLFKYVNTKKDFEKRNLQCASVDYQSSLTAPSYSMLTKTCIIQNEPLLYSCADSAKYQKRLCVCREFVKEQVALFPE